MAEERERNAPSMEVDGREMEVINLAMNLAEQKIRDGTASSQIICHFLKMGSPREIAEREALEAEIKLKEAKIKALEAVETSGELYQNAIAAFKKYSGCDLNED